ncbi:protein kinase domain-containing protein [Butyrivibrio proteoclasticus]|uniref:protein kinase domain-containing protein n=1 Tax=Butyrivibrio proteoclasticus TaxID=43305 RepID=UPI001F61399F|nr:hypothetical protein [Butyrivibrio proteoclasticus]
MDYLLRGDKDSYRIVDHIGDGSSCLVYKCESLKDHSLYIVKEFYPSYLNLTRNLDTGWISCKEDDKEDYAAGLLRFNNSIRIQKALRTRDNKVFVIHDDFEQNGTKYVAVAIYEGDIYLHNENMSLYERMQFCLSVAEHVKKCHAAGYLCLDIKPDNIFHIPDTAEFAMFFDFDSLIRIEDVESSHIIYYSERWAAPEQLRSLSNMITKQTDIYLLGELLFWSLFNRNSTHKEHRSFSVYNFKEAYQWEQLTKAAMSLITKILHSTIRSSSQNRYGAVEDFISDLGELIKEINPDRNGLQGDSRGIHQRNGLVGRSEEIQNLRSLALKSHVTYVYGSAGIGKSETLHKYIYDYYDDYSKVFFLTCSDGIIEAISNNESLIKGFTRHGDEEITAFCSRKIKRIKELCTETCLFVLDDFQVDYSNVDEVEAWEHFQEISGNIIVSARFQPEDMCSCAIKIDELTTNDLINLYYVYFCKDFVAFDDNIKDYQTVETIVNKAERNTYIIKLLAKYARQNGYCPDALLKRILKDGLFELDETVVCGDKEKTILKYTGQMLRLEQLSYEGKVILAILSLMPPEGVSKHVILKILGQNSKRVLNDLIELGLVDEDNELNVRIHSLSAQVIIAEIKDNDNIMMHLGDILKESVFLFSESTIDEVLKEEKIRIRISFAKHCMSYGLKSNSIAEFLVASFWFNKTYGNPLDHLDYLEYALSNIFESEDINQAEFELWREIAYLLFCNYSLYLPFDDSDFEFHKKLATEHGENLLAYAWLNTQVITKHGPYDVAVQEFYKKKAIENPSAIPLSSLSDKQLIFCIMAETIPFIIERYSFSHTLGEWDNECIDAAMELRKSYYPEDYMIQEHPHSLGEAASVAFYTVNRFYVLRDEIICMICLNKFCDAITFMNDWIESCKLSKADIRYSDIHKLKGYCYFSLEQYEDALSEYKALQDEIKAFNRIPDDYFYTQPKYLLSLCRCGDQSEALSRMQDFANILNDYIGIIDTVEWETLVRIFHAILFLCTDTFHYRSGYLAEAREGLVSTREILSKTDDRIKLKDEYLAYCIVLQGDVESELGNKSTAKKFYDEAYRFTASHFGNDHPRTLQCKKKLGILR